MTGVCLQLQSKRWQRRNVMTQKTKCVMCEADEGMSHPVTGKPLEEFVVNNRGTAYICVDCLTGSAAVAASKQSALTDDLEIRNFAEPVVHHEEHILPTHRAAKARLAAEAKAHQAKDKK
jgi:hypothetical protein